MGSGSSFSKVELIKNEKESSLVNRISSTKNLNLTCVQCKAKIELLQKNYHDLEHIIKSTTEENTNLKLNLEAIAGERNDLLDKISNLEDEVENLKIANTVQTDFQRIIENKDKEIFELDSKILSKQKRYDELKEKYELKIIKLQAKVLDLKQTNVLKLNDFKEKITKLEQENVELKNLNSIQASGDNTKLIIELSNLIAEKELKIEELNELLESKEKIISDFKLNNNEKCNNEGTMDSKNYRILSAPLNQPQSARRNESCTKTKFIFVKELNTEDDDND